MALCGFSVKNYRAFGERAEIALRPLTMLFGHNNAGKTSLLRVLPLLADSVGPGASRPLSLHGAAAKRAPFHEIRSRWSSRPAIEIGLRWDDEGNPISHLAFEVYDLPDQYRQVITKMEARDPRGEPVLTLDWNIDSEKAGLPDLYTVRSGTTVQDLPLSFGGLVPNLASAAGSEITGLVDGLRRRLLALPDQIHWLTAARVAVPRSDQYKGASLSRILPDGAGVLDALAADKRGPGRLLPRVSEWYESHFERKLDILFSGATGAEYSVALSPLRDPGTQINLADTGEGISQVLPVLASAAALDLSPSGTSSVLALEEPELHLHSDAQVYLAEYLCRIAASSGSPRMLVDTHSENFFLHVLLRIARGELSKDRVMIYWIQQTQDGHSFPEPVTLDDAGLAPGCVLGIHRAVQANPSCAQRDCTVVMKVVVDDRLFADESQSLGLYGLLNTLIDKPHHRIQVEPEEAPCFRAWLDLQRAPDVRAVGELLLASAVKLDVAEPSIRAIRLAPVGVADWDANPPVLPLELGTRFLNRPLLVWLEDVITDGAFLQTVSIGPRERKLRELLRDGGSIELHHGGGIDSMLRRLRDSAGSEVLLRSWVLFDSDALHPDRETQARFPSTSGRLQELCVEKRIAHHRLERRTIENYIPIPALHLWAQGQSKRQPILRLLRAYHRLTPGQRHHFNMKDGLAGDRERAEAQGLYAGLDPHAETCLQRGFGKNVAQVFQGHVARTREENLPRSPGHRASRSNFRIEESWLLEDGQTPETARMLDGLFSIL